ncbi:MAG: NAD(P)H-quinone oxidoreductase [Phototrophicaceae bacterium]|jgi:putative PIG3 family NAD(P)H quinone oxidoreductase
MRAVIAQDSKPILIDVPVPEPADGEVLVQVAATALNRADLLQVMGRYNPPQGVTETLGMEFAGTIVGVGAGVDASVIGQPIMALVAGGGYADYATVPLAHTLPLTEGYSMEQGAAFMEVFLTAYSNLVDFGRFQAGETVLIHAGASGVGLAAIQLVKAFGGVAVVTASGGKHAICTAHGADFCVDYKKANFADAILERYPDGVDVILEMVGAPYWNDNMRVIRPFGRIVFIGVMTGSRGEVDFRQIMTKRLTVTGSTLRDRTKAQKSTLVANFAAWATPHIAAGTLRPTVWNSYPLEQVEMAHRMMRDNQNAGKIVLTMNGA